MPSGSQQRYEAMRDEQGEPAAKDALRQLIRDYVYDTVEAWQGRITDWDVVNETTTQHVVLDILGEQELVNWFELARAADPAARLCFNDFHLLSGKHLENFERHVRLLLDAGAPLDVLCEQGHGLPLPMEQVFANLDRLASFGLGLQITEFDCASADERCQADWTRDLMTAAFSHPQMEGFTMWGFWDDRHWLGDAPLFYPDWTLKPSGEAWINLVHGEWWTRAEGATDAAGRYGVRGFLGEYEVVVRHAGRERTVPATLAKGGVTIEVRLSD